MAWTVSISTQEINGIAEAGLTYTDGVRKIAERYPLDEPTDVEVLVRRAKMRLRILDDMDAKAATVVADFEKAIPANTGL